MYGLGEYSSVQNSRTPYGVGLGDYFGRGNPCIPESTNVPAAVLYEGGGNMYWPPKGLTGCGCGCDGTGCGLGLFDDFNLGTWGLMEWGAIAAGAYVLFSVVATTSRGVTKVRRAVRRRRRKAE